MKHSSTGRGQRPHVLEVWLQTFLRLSNLSSRRFFNNWLTFIIQARGEEKSQGSCVLRPQEGSTETTSRRPERCHGRPQDQVPIGRIWLLGDVPGSVPHWWVDPFLICQSGVLDLGLSLYFEGMNALPSAQEARSMSRQKSRGGDVLQSWSGPHISGLRWELRERSGGSSLTAFFIPGMLPTRNGKGFQ